MEEKGLVYFLIHGAAEVEFEKGRLIVLLAILPIKR